MDDIYNPDAHVYTPPKSPSKSSRAASAAGRGIQKLFYYSLALVLGFIGCIGMLKFFASMYTGVFFDSTSEMAGEYFGAGLFGFVLAFIARKCIQKAREVGLY